MHVGQHVQVTTEPRLAVGGDALARAEDGRVVFIRGAAPEETVEARIVRVDKRFARAELTHIIRSGPDRIPPSCPHHANCGGCPLIHLDPAKAAQNKLEAGLGTLVRIGAVPSEQLRQVSLWQGASEGSRTRARLGVHGRTAGFRSLGSNCVTSIRVCGQLHPVLERARRTITGLIDQARFDERTGDVDELELVTNGEEVVVSLPPRLRRLAPQLEARGIRADSEALLLHDRAGPLLLRPEVFAQASLTANDALLDHLSECCLPGEGGTALELYAGSGNFTRLLAARFERVVAVERSTDAVRLGQALRLENVDWRACSAEQALDDNDLEPELILFDPPRSGLGESVRERLGQRQPPRMVYISCDVATLARDLFALQEAGASIQSIAAFDVYPRTSHMEWIVTLST